MKLTIEIFDWIGNRLITNYYVNWSIPIDYRLILIINDNQKSHKFSWSIVHRLSISIDWLISIAIDCYRLPSIIDFIDVQVLNKRKRTLNFTNVYSHDKIELDTFWVRQNLGHLYLIGFDSNNKQGVFLKSLAANDGMFPPSLEHQNTYSLKRFIARLLN